MGNIVYQALCKYFRTLESLGYLSSSDTYKLLLLIFYHRFVFHDFRGQLSEEDYKLIERALDCLYGSTCLIPYPDYLKMGKLYIGETSELARRVEALENERVLKAMAPGGTEDDSDIMIITNEDDDE